MLKIGKYNRNMSINYAQEYALTRNSNYFDYSQIGGNCTNFVSQCVYAGAPIMNYSENGWFYISPSKTSLSWANVEPLFSFITNNKGVGVFGKESPIAMCEPGDIIQLKFKNKEQFSHCLLVTEVITHTPKGIFICANSRDVKNVPVSFYSYEKIRLIHILGYRS